MLLRVCAGQMVIVVDDEDRESEGDLTVGEDHAAGHQLHGSVWPRIDLLGDDTREPRRARNPANGLAEQLAI